MAIMIVSSRACATKNVLKTSIRYFSVAKPHHFAASASVHKSNGQKWAHATSPFLGLSGLQPIRFCSTSTARLPEINKLRPDLKTHEDIYRFSIEQPAEFWGAEARSNLTWMQDFDTVMDCDTKTGKCVWFKNGKLNASVNCIDRHLKKNPDKVALIWEKDEPGQQEFITYKQLSDMVNQMANLFKSRGIKKGDIVAIYMPVCPMTVATMFACSRIGAIHSVVFAGFSAQALGSRIQDMSAVAVVTANEGLRGGRSIPLRKTVAETLANNQGSML